VPRRKRGRIHSRTCELEHLVATVQQQFAVFACGLLVRDEQNENERRASDLGMARMEGDLMRRQTNAPPIRDDLQLERGKSTRAGQGNQTVREALINP
jgi:hypothetical protein